jgi:hypothetical protein
MIEILKVKNIFLRRQLLLIVFVFSVLSLTVSSAFGHSSPSATRDQNTSPGSNNVKTDDSVNLLLPTQAQMQEMLDFYRSVFDRVYAENQDTYDTMAASGDHGTKDVYYTFQYVLAPTLSMYEALGDVSYLERALNWGSTMVDKAVIIDRDGFRNWSGDWDSPYADTPIYYMLWDLQGSTELARMARIVLTDESLAERYGAQAENIFNFVRNDIVEKHVWVRPGYSWFVYKACTELEETFNDKVVLLVRILNDVYQVSGESKHLDLNRQLAQCFQERLVPYGGGLIWDPGVGERGNSAMDTSHANRHPFAVTDLYRSGLVFGASQVQGLANLFTQVIWDGSLEEPRFTNFIDGTNHPAFDRPEWGLGYIYAGWVRLGEFDPMVQEVADATLRAIEQGKSNASLDYNGTHFGRLSLAGHLASNLIASNTTTFADVPFDHWAHDEIETLYQAGYVSGCSSSPLMYCPDATMTRGESAVFVERGIHGAGYVPPDPSQAVFADVPLGEWFAKWADGLWGDGYTAGCGTDPLNYCPLQEHTRTEGTVFFLRMMNGANYIPPDPTGIFSDVSTSYWGAKWIEAAYNAGLIPACATTPELRFCPDDPLDRAMAAFMMVQAKK